MCLNVIAGDLAVGQLFGLLGGIMLLLLKGNLQCFLLLFLGCHQFLKGLMLVCFLCVLLLQVSSDGPSSGQQSCL